MKKRSGKSAPQLSEELGKAIHLHQNGQFQQAKIIYKKIIRHSPMHPEALHMLGILYTQTGKHDTAVDLMRKSVKYAPVRPDYLFNLARAYHDLGSLDDSIATYQEFLRLVPDDSEALHWLGRVWHDKKVFEQAIIYYRRALEKSPERVDSLNSLGSTYREQGDFTQAVVCFEQALKYQPNDYIVLNNLGETFRELKKLDKAILCFRRALSVSPDCATSYNNIGVVFREEGKFEEAADNFKKATQLKPDYAAAYHNRGIALYNLGRLDEAVQSMQIAVKNAPGDSHIYDSLINLLNYYMPNIETGCPYVRAQKALQQVSTKYPITGMITDETVRQLYQQCHSILRLHQLDIIASEKSQIYRGTTSHNNCLRHMMVFNTFNIIPEYCFDCYKVTFEPRTVLELFKLLLLFDKLKLPKNNERKCIVEVRPEMSGTYKGFVYCKSLDEGKEVLNLVQSTIDETIAKGIPIFVKRGCSEFPIAYPEYGHITENELEQMTYNEQWRKHEAYFDKNLAKLANDDPNDFPPRHSGFTLLDAVVMHKWVAYATKIGDLSYLKIVK